jgi:hypothetical protein
VNSQRPLVQQAVNMADSPQDRKGSYPDRRRQKVDGTPEFWEELRQVIREEIQREMGIRGRRAAASE